MKVGAVGLGSRTATVFNELSKINPNTRMISYVDPFPIGKKFAEENNFLPSRSYETLSEMLTNENLDLLMVGSPNHLHLQHIKQGLEAGLKIFAEKPIVINLEQTFALAKLIKKYGQDKIIVGLVLRYSQHARAINELLNKKKNR